MSLLNIFIQIELNDDQSNEPHDDFIDVHNDSVTQLKQIASSLGEGTESSDTGA